MSLKTRSTRFSSSLDARSVKANCNFLALASRYTGLRRAGREYVGLCPLHRERHPSFCINADRKIFHCFGCGAGGDLFKFVMLVEVCNFRRALEIVAELQGIARECEPRSGERNRAGVGASPPAAKRPALYSPAHSADWAEWRTRAWEATMRAHIREIALPCEPFDEHASLLLV
jgi:hypothetical protein